MDDSTQVMSTDDKPTQVLESTDDATVNTVSIPIIRTATGTSNVNAGGDYDMPSFDDIKTPKPSYAFTGGDENLKNKPITKRPAFWVITVLIALFITIPTASNLFKPHVSSYTPTVEPSAIQQASPSGKGSDGSFHDNASNDGNALPQDVKAKADSFDWSSLDGQRLSNAYALMDNAGLNQRHFKTNIVTDNGKYVIMPSNWTVESVDYNASNGSLLFHVRYENGTSSQIQNNSQPDTDNNQSGTTDNPVSNGFNYLKEQAGKIDTDKLKENIGNGYNKLKDGLEQSFDNNAGN